MLFDQRAQSVKIGRTPLINTTMNKADIRLLTSVANHLTRIFDRYPNLPLDTDNRTYNAYRVLRRTELPRLLRKLEQWNKNTEHSD